MSRSGAGPERTCVGCRGVAPRDELVRVVVGLENQLMVDRKGTLPGRGAWVHPRAGCVEALEAAPKLLARSLRATPSVEGFGAHLRAVIYRQALDGLSMAQAAGALVGGRDLLSRALRAEDCVAVVVATDASPRGMAEFRAIAGDAVPFVTLNLDRDGLGARIGKGPRAALGVRRSRAAAHLIRQLHRLSDLG